MGMQLKLRYLFHDRYWVEWVASVPNSSQKVFLYVSILCKLTTTPEKGVQMFNFSQLSQHFEYK